MRKQLIPFFLASQLIIAAAVNYSYDASGRLIQINYAAGGSISYTYDNAGNITSRIVQAGMTPSVIASARLIHTPQGESRIEITGTNLAGDTSTVTIDGKPASILSRCNATLSHTCRTDQLTTSAPAPETRGKVRIVVSDGTVSSPPFAARIP